MGVLRDIPSLLSAILTRIPALQLTGPPADGMVCAFRSISLQALPVLGIRDVGRESLVSRAFNLPPQKQSTNRNSRCSLFPVTLLHSFSIFKAHINAFLDKVILFVILKL